MEGFCNLFGQGAITSFHMLSLYLWHLIVGLNDPQIISQHLKWDFIM